MIGGGWTFHSGGGYSIVNELRKCAAEKAEKRRKKFLTNSFGFDILNKLLRKGRRPEKFGKEKERLENLKKRLKKVLDKANDFWYTE